jgi:uncharacterized protein with HEPN domain
MDVGPETDPLQLDQIVELIELIRTSLAGVDEADFLRDRMMGDGTALRLGAIGQATRKLSAELRERHPAIGWHKMYGLRNIVAHHYRRLNYRILWETATGALDELEEACRYELSRIDP